MRLTTTLALVVAVTVVAATAANAGPPVRETIHDEYAFEIEDFCDVDGLTVAIAGVLDMSVKIRPRGPAGLEYFLQHGTVTETLTANGTTLRSVATVNEKDLRVTDNGDGTVTVLILATGNAVLYGPDGKAIARNPGQTRFVIVFDEAGNQLSREVVKGSTGRSDDVCSAAVPALT